jgi:hypothetical protein
MNSQRINREVVQNRIMEYIELQEKRNRKPDLLSIMNKVSRESGCEPVQVVNGVRALQRKLKLIKVHIGFITTYRIVHNL